jgi:transketolase
MSGYKNIADMPLKTPLDPLKDRLAIRDLQLAALTMRRKILYMGHCNRIKLHYGALLSMTDLITMLYTHWLNIDPENPGWPERDRFVLSKGHGAPALYIALWMRGFFHESNFDGFRRLHSILQGHPDHLKTPGVDCSSRSPVGWL